MHTAIDAPLFDDEMSVRLAAMRRLLAETRPETGDAALRALRRSFPDAPLAERVIALQAAPR